MVDDDESHDMASEPSSGAPGHRDVRPDGGIEGEGVAEEPKEAAAEPAAESANGASRPPRPPGAGRALAAGAVGGAIAAALVAAGVYLLPVKAGLTDADANRITALETAASREDVAVAALDKRIGALEGAHGPATTAALEKRVGALEASASQSNVEGLEKRVGALETARAAEGQKTVSETGTVQNLTGDMGALRADVDAARGEIPDLAARVSKLEASVSSANLAAIAGKVDKLESALAAPKAETRVAPEKPTASDNPAALAIIAQAIEAKLASGAPFPNELAALATLGVDPAKLAPLKAISGGAPTGHALAASFEAIEPKALAAVASGETGGVGGRFLANLSNLVQIRRIGETQGDDPQALASQVVARLERGDLVGALAAFARLPEPARQAASAWAAEAGAKQAAVAAAEALRDSAVARLAENAKP